MLGEAPFANFMAFSDWLYTRLDATHRIALDRLARLVGQWLQTRGLSAAEADALLAQDYAGRHEHHAPVATNAAPARQARHLAA
jgi:hypothetical protein